MAFFTPLVHLLLEVCIIMIFSNLLAEFFSFSHSFDGCVNIIFHSFLRVYIWRRGLYDVELIARLMNHVLVNLRIDFIRSSHAIEKDKKNFIYNYFLTHCWSIFRHWNNFFLCVLKIMWKKNIFTHSWRQQSNKLKKFANEKKKKKTFSNSSSHDDKRKPQKPKIRSR